MTGISDLAQKTNPQPGDSLSLKNVAKPLKVLGEGANLGIQKDNFAISTGAAQKKQQLQTATDANAAAQAASDAQIASDAAAAEKKRRAGIVPIQDPSATAANAQRVAAAQLSSGRQSTILTGQRLGD